MTYSPIYTDFANRILIRIPQLQSGDTNLVLIYQQYIDSHINNTIRSIVGDTDKNGFRINLPLTGVYDVIDLQKMEVSLKMDAEVQMAADACVISRFRQDTAENEEKLKIAEAELDEVLFTKYGGVSSIPQDFTTEFLTQNFLTWENGEFIALEDGSGVLLQDVPIFASSTNQNAINSRVIFVRAP